MRESIGYFLRPTRGKVLVALLLPYVEIAWRRLFFYFFVEPSEVFPGSVSSASAEPVFLLFRFILNLFYSVLLYPLACSIYAIVGAIRSREIREVYRTREYLALLLVGLFVFNPISLTLIFITPFFLYASFFGTPYPVVQVEEISPYSPLVDTLEPKYVIVGIRIRRYELVKVNEAYYYDKIVYSREFRIENTTAFYETLEQAKPGDSISFKAHDGSSYPYVVEGNITDWGIKVKDITLKR